MYTKGIRGAITVDNNSEVSIKAATLELFGTMLIDNDIEDVSNISHVIFTLTPDLNAAFPAKFIREDLKLDNLAMMCYHELDVPDAIENCLRILIVLNCSKDFVPKFVYLKGAKKLR
ncbi:chorismate mutase [bacterium]|nr:chorismate mutase [bacterium]